MLSKPAFSDFSQKIYAFMLTFVLLLSTIVLFTPQSEAENDDIWLEVYFNNERGHLSGEIGFGGNYSKNYTIVWSISDEEGTVMAYDYQEFNETSDHWMNIQVDTFSYPSGDYNFTVDLYEESTLVEDFEESFEVHPWLIVDFPYHLPEAGDVNLSIAVVAAESDTNYSIKWNLEDYNTGDDVMNNATNFTDYNWTLNLSKGHYELSVILYEEVESNNSGNDTYWDEIDWTYMRLYIGGALLWMNVYNEDDHLNVNMEVEFGDYDTNYTAVWNITDYNGNLIDNGVTSFSNGEPWHYFSISTVNYSAGDYWLNVDLYSGVANSTDVYESSTDKHFWIHTVVQVWPEEYQYENEGNITILFDAYHVNTSRDYRIEWNLFDKDELLEVDSGEIYMNSTTNFSGNFTTIFLTESDYGIEASLYEWAPVNNGTDWNWTFVDHSYRNFHVGGAELDVWHGFEGNGLHFNGCVQYADWTVNYTGDWKITDENNMLVAQGAIQFDEWENCFHFNLPANDFEWRETYTAVFDLYENGTYLNNYTFDLEVYLLFDFFIDNHWDNGSYVNGTYHLNTGNENYTLNWSLKGEDGLSNYMETGSFDSNSGNGMLEFFNIPKGYYHLNIDITLENQLNCSNCTNNTYNETYYFHFYFEVDDDPVVPNTAPYCDLNGTLVSGANINASVGDTFTFGMECWDDDGDNVTMYAGVDYLGTLSSFVDITGNTSSWTYTFADTGLYTFGLSVKDNYGGQSSYAFTATVLGNNTGCQPNYDLNAANLADGECCSSGGQCASGNCNYTTWACEADNTTNNNTTNNNTANNNTTNNNTANNNTGTNETEELLADIESGEVPSISALVSAVTIALIAFRRRYD